jgi:hypothetical protein
MRTLLIGALIAVSPAASAEPASLMKRSVAESMTLEIRYDGEGWRNLRKVTFVTGWSGVEIPEDYYFVCGTDTLIELADTDSAKALNKGSKLSLASEEIIGLAPLNDEVRKASLAALANTCKTQPASQLLPKYVGLSMSRSELTYLLPERFSRSGDQVSMWMRTDYLTNEQRQLPWGKEPFTVSFRDDASGYAIQKMEVNCSTGRYRVMNFVAYHNDGTPIDGKSIATDYGTFIETVPGSVGEAQVATGCLIR